MKKEKSTDSHWGNSLRFLSWEEEEMDPGQKLITSTVHEWYDAKHRKISEEEIRLINSLQIEKCQECGSKDIIKSGFYHDIQRYKCKSCGSKDIIKSGFYHDIQRYKCKSCGVRFSPLTNTIFEDRKIPISEWIEYLMHLFEFHSIVSSARDNRNAVTTGKYWLIKIFEVLKGIQEPVVLKGRIYCDEMFFPVIKHKTVVKDGKKLRGISRNKIAVAVAYDEYGQFILNVEWTSKPSDKSTWAALGAHIERGSHLIHDGERSHGILIRDLNLTSEVYDTEATKGMPDDKNPLDPINNIHDLAKRFMKAHGGYNRDNLQDWMNLIWFILSEPKNRYEKIYKFINLAIYSPKRVKYRDVMSKKHSD